jgi:hypothetical protein
MVSSPMPKIAPPSENAMNSTLSSSQSRLPVSAIRRSRPRSIAPEACTTAKLPPMMKTKAMTPIAAPVRLPDAKPSNRKFRKPGPCPSENRASPCSGSTRLKLPSDSGCPGANCPAGTSRLTALKPSATRNSSSRVLRPLGSGLAFNRISRQARKQKAVDRNTGRQVAARPKWHAELVRDRTRPTHATSRAHRVGPGPPTLHREHIGWALAHRKPCSRHARGSREAHAAREHPQDRPHALGHAKDHGGPGPTL